MTARATTQAGRDLVAVISDEGLVTHEDVVRIENEARGLRWPSPSDEEAVTQLRIAINAVAKAARAVGEKPRASDVLAMLSAWRVGEDESS